MMKKIGNQAVENFRLQIFVPIRQPADAGLILLLRRRLKLSI